MVNNELTELNKELDKVNVEINECACHYSPKLYDKKRELTNKIKLLEKGHVDASDKKK
jgi:methionine aminopeptidase